MTEIRLAANYVDIASAFGNFDNNDSNRNYLNFVIWAHGCRVGWRDEADEVQHGGQFGPWDCNIVVVCEL